MSSNQTTNYGLHVWQPTDDFLREEFNENFGEIDMVLHRANVVTGTYNATGAGSYSNPLEIVLGFRPRAVLVMANIGSAANVTPKMVGLALDGSPVGQLTITDTGFIVNYFLNAPQSSYCCDPYSYIIWR